MVAVEEDIGFSGQILGSNLFWLAMRLVASLSAVRHSLASVRGEFFFRVKLNYFSNRWRAARFSVGMARGQGPNWEEQAAVLSPGRAGESSGPVIPVLRCQQPSVGMIAT